MLKFLNILAVSVLVGSALFVYSIKYETILFAEQILKTKHQISSEQDAITRLEAEWAVLTRPERLQVLADQHTNLKLLSLDQIVQIADMPDRPPPVDSIGRKLESLGLAAPTNTPKDGQTAGGTSTPSATAR